ncbi:hypothetical protein [Microbulbifer agarilyticus]
MKKITLLLFSLFSSSSTLANNANTGTTEILKIENWTASEGLYIHTAQTSLTNPAGCTVLDKYHMSPEASNMSKSMVLSAYTAKSQVSMTILGSGCSSNRPKIVSVVLQ